MKILRLLLMLLVAINVHAQFDFAPSNYFYVDTYGLRYIDSLLVAKDDNHYAQLPDYPNVRTIKSIASFKRYQVKVTGNNVELNQIGDSLIVYLEGANLSSYFKERDIAYHGELRISKQTIGINHSDLPLSDEFGEPQIRIDSTGVEHFVYDTAFALVPHGLWRCKLDSISYEMGEYEMGVRIGEWKTFSSRYYTFRESPVLNLKQYENGKLVSETTQNKLLKLEKIKDIQDALEGEWYNTGMGMGEWSYCLQGGQCSYVFSRDSMDGSWSGNHSLDFIYLKKSGAFDKVVGKTCGTGPDYNESYRRKEWFINPQRNLNLDGRVYRLTFLSEDRMVLSFQFDNE